MAVKRRAKNAAYSQACEGMLYRNSSDLNTIFARLMTMHYSSNASFK